MSREPICSVVIPAHNESATIRRLLTALAGAPKGEVDVVVVANGCTDDTAGVARSFADQIRLRVLEVGTASKSEAMNRADAVTTALPRAYVDADVVVTPRALQAVCSELHGNSQTLAARPPISYQTSRASIPVRAFYRARSRTPSLMNSLWGAGFYAVSLAGRQRWQSFPTDIADDAYVDMQFGQTEVKVIATDPVLVTPPLTTGSLVRTLRRVYRVGRQRGSAGRRSSLATLKQVVFANMNRPAHLIDAAIYICIAVVARLSPTLQAEGTWERDATTR